MVTDLLPTKGVMGLLNLAFDLGGLQKVFALIHIKRLIGKKDISAATEGCHKQILRSAKVKFWSDSEAPRSPNDNRLSAGELLYTLGAEMEAIDRVLLPAIGELMDLGDMTEARFNLEEILRRHPESVEAQSLLKKVAY
jgi:hypothetical protein